MWICCRCQTITDEYPSNSYCKNCKSEDDFDEITEEEAEEINNELLRTIKQH